MKRKREVDSEEDSTDTESDIFSDDELSKSDEHEIGEMVQQLPNSIPRKKAIDLLHSMATSKDILYWNSHGEMTYHQRRIPVTSMRELIEYALLPYNLDVKTPRGLKTFTDGLSELDVDKDLIRNKRMLVDLVARQPEGENTEDSTSEAESQTSDESSQEEESGEEQEETESESSESEDELECHVCREPKPFSKISIVQCPRCLWHEAYYCRMNHLVECTICRNVFPTSEQTTKTTFCRCQDCNAVHQLSLKFKKLKLIDSQPKELEEERYEV